MRITELNPIVSNKNRASLMENNESFLKDPEEIKEYFLKTLMVLPKIIEKIDEDGYVYIKPNFVFSIEVGNNITNIPIRLKRAETINVLSNNLENFDFLPDQVDKLEIIGLKKEFKINKKISILERATFEECNFGTLNLSDFEFDPQAQLMISKCNNFSDFSGECEYIKTITLHECNAYSKLGTFPKSILRLHLTSCKKLETLSGISKKIKFKENTGGAVIHINDCPIKRDILGLLRMNEMPKLIIINLRGKTHKAFTTIQDQMILHPEGIKQSEVMDIQNSFFEMNDEEMEDFAGL